MVSIRTTKGLLLGSLLVTAYCSFIVDIVQILKVIRGQGESNYPPAVVALLVASLCQMLYSVWLIADGGWGKKFTAMNIMIAQFILFLFTLASVIAVTVLRYTDRYCPPYAPNFNDCGGVLKGTMGTGWSTVGFQLIYMGFLFYLVRGYGSWDEELWNIPEVPKPNADMEKAPVH